MVRAATDGFQSGRQTRQPFSSAMAIIERTPMV
jgi:hypothetical protein